MTQLNRFWIFTHNFTNTGAPLVMAAIAHELADKGFQKHIRLISLGGEHDRRYSTLQNQLAADGFTYEILDLDSPLLGLVRGTES